LLIFMTMNFNAIAIAAIAAGILSVAWRQPKVVGIASRYVGKQEIYNNRGFSDTLFHNEMLAVGWQPPQAWCMYFVRLVCTKAYPKLTALRVLISPSSQTTWNNFQKDTSGKYQIVSFPKPGDIVIFQYWKDGMPTTSGHAGVVIKASQKEFQTIEGNTSTDGTNQGKVVAKRVRRYIYQLETGLIIKGFIRITA